ncbi:hypothetical protein MSPP1_004156 [Malassezia sp. CBS 17886]|nr:hypothetical protein MSPP1_004156 [Malassezia sp. CBS 17886]
MASAWEAAVLLYTCETYALSCCLVVLACGVVVHRVWPARARAPCTQSTVVVEEAVDVGVFWQSQRRRVLAMRALALVGFVALLVSHAPAGPATFLPYVVLFATLGLYDFGKPPRSATGHSDRALALQVQTSALFVAALAELFLATFGVPFAAGRVASLLVLWTLFLVSGFTPCAPTHVAVGGGVFEKCVAELHDTDQVPTEMPIAPTAASQSSLMDLFFFTSVLHLLHAARRHGSLRAMDVPVISGTLQAEWIAGATYALCERYLWTDAPPAADGAQEGGGLRAALGVPVGDADAYADVSADLAEHGEVYTLADHAEPAAGVPAGAPAGAPAARGQRGAGALVYVLLRANESLLVGMVLLTVVAVGFYYLPTFFASRIFAVLEDERKGTETPAQTVKRALPWVLSLFFTIIVSSTLQSRLWAILEGLLTVRLSTQLSTLLYGKTLRKREETRAPRDTADEAPINTSQVLTLHLVDLKRVVDMAFHIFALVTVPFELLVGGYFAYRILGVSAVYGLSSTLLLVPLIAFVSRYFARATERLMAARDRRLGLLNECFLGIRMIKSQAWEARFRDRVEVTRRGELHEQRTVFALNAFLSMVMELNPLLVTLVAFAHYTIMLGHELTPRAAFTSLAVFSELRFTLTMLPQTLTNTMQAFVSLRRINEYLQAPDVPPFTDTADADAHAPPAALPRVACEDATVAFPHDQSRAGTEPPFALTHLSIEFPAGRRTLICGRVGAGKSLLLQALLHEADTLHGRVICPRSPQDGIPHNAASERAALSALDTAHWTRPDLVAYAPQVPFLLNTSIRDNILFGLPLGSRRRYHATIEACGLQRDLAELDRGDLTDVGENGTELSGGQKARVALARAVYSRASVLLLDDVLSAVDASTAKHVAQALFTGVLVRGRTVVLVSHNAQLVAPLAEQVVVLARGTAVFQGTGDEFLASPHYSGFAEPRETPKERGADGAPPPPEMAEDHDAADASLLGDDTRKRAGEHSEKGTIAWAVWREYVHASSGWRLCTVSMFLLVVTNLWDLVNNGWLRDWSAAGTGRGEHSNGWWLSRYALLVGIGTLLGTLRWVGLFSMSLIASKRLFGKMLWRTLRASIRFHDTASRGRLLNRFGQDLEVLDSEFAQSIADAGIRSTQLLATCIAMYMVSGWQFVLALLILLPVYAAIGKAYLVVARDLQRLNATSRSLVVCAFGNAVHGATVLRAFGAQVRFTNDMDAVLDNNNRYVWWKSQSSRWVSQMFNLISAGLVFVACLIVLGQPNLDAASADFSIMFLINFNFVLLILMRMYAVLQTNGVAVERVFEYASTIDQEGPETVSPAPPRDWPSAGHVVVQDFTARYAPDLPDVLKNLSFDIPGGAKLAVVGPTGSGKSTLASAFLRFVEAQSGRIVIDGWDIAQIGLRDLRSRLQIVPQDPVIVSGTLRSVLDVCDEFTNEQLLASLRAVHLLPQPGEVRANAARPPFADLNFAITENGANLSQGERQLLCLARAILRRARVVLFDEASSSIDYETDKQISTVIHDAFEGSTILTIAHRLRSVITYDRVLFMDRGRVAEMGTPDELLRNRHSRFYQLCQSAGPAEFAYLVHAARGGGIRGAEKGAVGDRGEGHRSAGAQARRGRGAEAHRGGE